jgi:hypothetical protein
VLALAFAVALARGGRIARLADVNVRFFPLLFLPLTLQLLLYSPLPGFEPLLAGGYSSILHIATFGIAALVVCANLRLPGFPLLLLGLLANLAVIAANGGYMPVSAPAREIADLPALAGPRNNVIPMSVSPHLLLATSSRCPHSCPLVVYQHRRRLNRAGLFWFISQRRGARRRAVRMSRRSSVQLKSSFECIRFMALL